MRLLRHGKAETCFCSSWFVQALRDRADRHWAADYRRERRKRKRDGRCVEIAQKGQKGRDRVTAARCTPSQSMRPSRMHDEAYSLVTVQTALCQSVLFSFPPVDFASSGCTPSPILRTASLKRFALSIPLGDDEVAAVLPGTDRSEWAATLASNLKLRRRDYSRSGAGQESGFKAGGARAAVIDWQKSRRRLNVSRARGFP